MTARERFEGTLRSSRKLFERAEAVIPSGITHDGRFLRPFPPYFVRARGSRKWDVDGREYIDYWMGHGALLLGHGHPAIIQALHEQIDKGLHYGGCHELEVAWAEMICRLVPCAEKVRFTSSGSEAIQLALRLARAATGRSKVVKLKGHFHGWHDSVMLAVDPPFDVPPTIGLPEQLAESVLLCAQSDVRALTAFLNRDDVAGVVLEPSGASFGKIPIRPEFLKVLRHLTADRGTVLIFDEVVTGFRYAVGGAQEYYGVTPDLAVLGKIVSGGITGGAVCGRHDLLDLLAFTDDPKRNRYQRVAHRGTFSGNPLVAAAGVACLEQLRDGTAIVEANQQAASLRKGMNSIIDRHGLSMAVYGDASTFHICLNHGGAASVAGRFDPLGVDPAVLKGAKSEVVHAFRCGMLLHGVDPMRDSGLLSSAHTATDVDRTVDAFDKTLSLLREERVIG